MLFPDSLPLAASQARRNWAGQNSPSKELSDESGVSDESSSGMTTWSWGLRVDSSRMCYVCGLNVVIDDVATVVAHGLV